MKQITRTELLQLQRAQKVLTKLADQFGPRPTLSMPAAEACDSIRVLLGNAEAGGWLRVRP